MAKSGVCLQGLWEIGDVLAERRAAKGLSMGEVAKRAGCSPSQICYLETKRRFPRPELLDKLLSAVGLELVVR